MVRAPVSSLKLIEDLSVAYAWRHTNRYTLEPMDEYLVMLKHGTENFPGGRIPNPMTALGVPRVIIGPGELGISGQRDEHVALADLRAAAKLYEAIARGWLGHG